MNYEILSIRIRRNGEELSNRNKRIEGEFTLSVLAGIFIYISYNTSINVFK